MKQLVIYGAGGFAREVLALVHDINQESQRWDVLGFLSDDAATWGQTVNELPILGGQRWIEERRASVAVALAIGSPPVKRRTVQRASGANLSWATLVHPSVVASSYVVYGAGVVVTAGTILTSNIELADFSMLNLACTVGHDCTIGRYATTSPGVNVSGNVRIGEGCDIGTGAAIIQSVEIGQWSIVGAGAVVTRSLPANCTAVGTPARVVKERRHGWQDE